MFSSALVNLFVCFEDYAKTTQLNFTKLVGNVAHWPRKKPLYYVGNSEYVTLVLWSGSRGQERDGDTENGVLCSAVLRLG